MEPSRLMLDSMVFDAIADDDGLRARLVDLVEKGVTELLITHIQADQLASIPDETARKRLLAVAFSLGLPCSS